jgi:hypothetical protein
MSRFAVASSFGSHRRFFTGVIASVMPAQPLRALDIPTAPAEPFWIAPSREAAAAVARGLTDICAELAGDDARTWYAVELPDAVKL